MPSDGHSSLPFSGLYLTQSLRGYFPHTSNQTMKPTPKGFASRLAPFPDNFSLFAMAPWISSRCPATLVRLKLVLCPHSLAPTLVVLPSMSLGPPLHSLGSRTPAVLFFNASRGLSLSR